MLESAADILPTSIPRETRDEVMIRGVRCKPIYCANCGVAGGWVHAECTFAMWLCDAVCAPKWQHLVGTTLIPDEIFFRRVEQAQLEAYGRVLTAAEIVEELKNSDSPLAKLARDRSALPEYQRR